MAEQMRLPRTPQFSLSGRTQLLAPTDAVQLMRVDLVC